MASTPPRGDAALVCVSRATPRWVRRRPLLLAGWLRLSNRVGQAKVAWLGGALLGLVGFVWLVTRPTAAAVLSFIADRWVLGFLGAAIHAANSVSRRKSRLQAERENSWLAALPYRVSVPARIAFGFGVQLVAIALFCAGIAAVGAGTGVSASTAVAAGAGTATGTAAGAAAGTAPGAAAGTAPGAAAAAGAGAGAAAAGAAAAAPWLDARTVWLAIFGGYVAGGLAGWFAHVFGPKSASTPGTQYAIVRRVRDRWAVDPKLHPLSYWPVAAARALANPQVSMRTMVFVLLALPLGTTGAEAIAVGAAWMAGLYALLNLVATVRTAFAAGWWLRPTPVRLDRFAGTLAYRVLVIEVGVFVAAIFAMAAIGKPHLFYITVSATIAWLPMYVVIAMVACAIALRPAQHAKRPSIAGRLGADSSHDGRPS